VGEENTHTTEWQKQQQQQQQGEGKGQPALTLLLFWKREGLQWSPILKEE
jgi:hypothetical protein